MIIATAGHVDHGKTSLIRQLTGVDTDRLAEEKRRGLSINLGYAYLPRRDGIALGFIDVPGHQRFINTMISGISGIDMGMLVVAADDGPMPQTHEHLDVLELLGVERLTVVISKIDRVDEQRLAQVRSQLQQDLEARRWQTPEVFPIDNTAGDGVQPLKDHLLAQAEQTSIRDSAGYFRLSIDRAFTAKGAGLVITGTASAGAVRVGDSLSLAPEGLPVRVREIRAHDKMAETGRAGQRLALNIVGKVDASAISRGDWLLDPESTACSTRLDVEFSLRRDAPFALKHMSPVKLYVGAKKLAGRLAILNPSPTDGDPANNKTDQGNRLQPGSHCLAQLILEEEVSCVHGDRLLLRDHAENTILGGATVLDPQGPKSGKSRTGRIVWLKAMQAATPAKALEELINQHQLVDLPRFAKAWNLREPDWNALLPAAGRSFTSQGQTWLVSKSQWRQATEQLMATIVQWHGEQPLAPGIKMTTLQPLLAREYPPALALAVIVSQLEAGELQLHEGHIRRTGFTPAQSGEALDQWRRVAQCLERLGNKVPLQSELADQTGMSSAQLAAVLKKAVKTGELLRINDTRYMLPGQLMAFSQQVLSCDSSGDTLSIVNLKSRFATGRKLTIEIMEYFDSVHFTRRQGNDRVILNAEVPQKLFTAPT